MADLCDPCRRRIALVKEKRRLGKPTLLTQARCDECKERENAAHRKGGHGGDRTSAAFRAKQQLR